MRPILSVRPREIKARPRVTPRRARASVDSLPVTIATFLVVLFLLPGAGLQAGDLELRATPVPLDPLDPARTRLEQLVFRGGLELVAGDPSFGGWSGMVVDPEGRQIRAVSDQGYWLEARLDHDVQGRLTGVADVRIGPLQGLAGRPLTGKVDADAESLTRRPDGGLLVGFEHRSRILEYAGNLEGRPRDVPPPLELAQAPDNGGLESLVALRDGRLLALSEALSDGAARVGWIGDGEGWSRLLYVPAPGFDPSDAAQLPSGDLVVLERAYSVIEGPRSRLVRVPAEQVAAGATLEGELLGEWRRPLTVDNFEGLAAFRGAEGQTLVYLLSDDNYNRDGQRTLLLLFELGTSEGAPGGGS
jgi:hypothetical protein